jgi:hypothetical protein
MDWVADIRGICIPDLFYYQFIVLGLLWVFVMLSVTGSSASLTQEPKRAKPIEPPRKRSKAPKAFAGLTHQPFCVRCAQEPTQPQPSLALPPAPMPATKRRPRQVDTSLPFCPHTTCAYCGWLGLGNLRANGHPSGGPLAAIPLHGL